MDLTIEQWIDHIESLETIDENCRSDSIIIRSGADEYIRLCKFLEPEEMLSKISIESQYIFALLIKQTWEI